MTAPSNANTSGLEVVAWEYRYPDTEPWHKTMSKREVDEEREDGSEVRPYAVTAASAQARIAELEADVNAAHAAGRFLIAAEKTRSDRLAERLKADPTPEQLEPFARKWCIDNGIDPDEPKAPHGEWPEWYDACGPFAAMWRDLATHTLQQEG